MNVVADSAIAALQRNVAAPTPEAYAELQQAYDHFNQALFGGQLPGCLITLQREKRTCGYFSAERFAHVDGQTTDEIAINPAYFAVVPIAETMQTLVHEMCHLWQYRFGKPGRARYHNEEWAARMESIGLMPSSTGRPGGKRTGDMMADYAIETGAFLGACAALLTSDFRISWYDRFPTFEHVQHGQNSLAMQLDASVGGGSVPLATNTALANAMRPGADIRASGEASQTALNKSNRTKYACSCRHQVWGKPGLHLVCGECGERFGATPSLQPGPPLMNRSS